VATGFDESYYANRSPANAELLRRAAEEEGLKTAVVDEASMKDLDMELKEGGQEATGAEDFHKDEGPNIWALGDDEQNSSDQPPEEPKEDIDKPSFLRRALGRGKKSEDDQTQALGDDDQADDDYGQVDDEDETSDDQPAEPETPKAKKGK
jgi:hypothetical protein